ncbi:ATP-binding response regulator [Pedobacter hartonius]|uniref:histidine kinase n=1 Tax=Pedobacter hartonius TaxID=425514 RepID=A0A1H4GQK8_9SPHI|nr:histidine kinase [Pedobacter hartonius]SEB11824.1 Histidine kinase-, DNA gyrase B-, and HSP90-like ATPase [Pedobacter hartonius]
MNTDRSDYRILVVEDNPGDFALVEDFIFEQIEAPVIVQAKTFKTAKEILTKKRNDYTTVLLDLSLSDHAGEPLIHEIVELCGDIPVIVLTGYTDFAFGVKSLSLGVSDYLLKEDLTATSLYKSMVYSSERKKIISALETSEQDVRNFANQLNNALEAERSRIAREIHDEFGQQLSGLKMSLSSLKKSKGVGHDIEKLIDVLIVDVNTSIASVRQIANELRPVLIDKLGLFAAIEWLVNEFENKNRVKSQLYKDTDWYGIDEKLEINIYRICQEALTNIAKHAKATLVKIRLENRVDQLSVTISDDGRGIKSSTLHNPLSMGLLNMKERANLIGAALNISSSSDSGTLIELIVNKNGQKNINSR